jgi:hypothetical protein
MTEEITSSTQPWNENKRKLNRKTHDDI